jgi:hypothetical protein
MENNRKLLIGLSMLFILSAPFLCPVYAEPSTIDRIVFIHYRAKGAPSKGTTPTDQATNYKYTGIHWLNLPVTYEVNPSASGINNPTAVMTAIQSAFETWDKSTGKELFYNIVTTTTRAGSSTSDGHNVVSWAFMSDSNTIAITYIWYNRATKAIVECDTILNTRFLWSLDPPSQTQMSIQNIATHEAGHWIMLGDLYTYKDSQLTMYGYSTEGEIIKETLGKGDVLGVQKAYGP